MSEAPKRERARAAKRPRRGAPPPWLPAQLAIGRRIARHKRLIANGLAPPGDKASLCAAAEDAARNHPIRKVT